MSALKLSVYKWRQQKSNTMPSEFHITTHAVDQFIRRWRTDKSHQQAHEELEALLRTSKADGKTATGDQIHISGHFPEIRMVVKERTVCVTVLPKSNREEDNLEDLLREEAEYLEMAQKKHQEKYQQEINSAEQELAIIEEERKRLGLQKTKLLNKLQTLRNKAKYDLFFK